MISSDDRSVPNMMRRISHDVLEAYSLVLVNVKKFLGVRLS